MNGHESRLLLTLLEWTEMRTNAESVLARYAKETGTALDPQEFLDPGEGPSVSIALTPALEKYLTDADLSQYWDTPSRRLVVLVQSQEGN